MLWAWKVLLEFSTCGDVQWLLSFFLQLWIRLVGVRVGQFHFALVLWPVWKTTGNFINHNSGGITCLYDTYVYTNFTDRLSSGNWLCVNILHLQICINECNIRINLHNKNKQTVQTWVWGMVCLSFHLRTWLFAHFSWGIEAKGSLMDLEPQFPINSVPCSIHCILCCHPPPRSSYGSPRKSLSIDGVSCNELD